jgi:hypothetical protein
MIDSPNWVSSTTSWTKKSLPARHPCFFHNYLGNLLAFYVECGALPPLSFFWAACEQNQKTKAAKERRSPNCAAIYEKHNLTKIQQEYSSHPTPWRTPIVLSAQLQAVVVAPPHKKAAGIWDAGSSIAQAIDSDSTVTR